MQIYKSSGSDKYFFSREKSYFFFPLFYIRFCT